MDKFVIRGGAPQRRPLRGPLPVSGSKNTALPLMAAALLAEGPSRITNVPALRDVRTFANVLRIAGPSVTFDDDNGTLTIDARTVDHPVAPYDLVKKMRASFYMLGALLGRTGRAKVSLPGGCAWGPRPVDLHLKGLKAFGAQIDLEAGYVIASAPGGRLDGGAFRMEPSSVGATVNLLLGAVTARGPSRIENAAQEPDVVAFGEALRQMGAQIDGLGTRTIEVEGTDGLRPARLRNTPDRIELGTFLLMALTAGAPGTPIAVTGGQHEHLGHAFKEALAATGATVDYGTGTVTLTPPERIRPVSIETGTYPGFPTDLQAQWTVALLASGGQGTVTDTVYDDRFKHVPELQRLGADITVTGNTATVNGASTNGASANGASSEGAARASLTGAQVMSTDLRASVSLVMAGLIAEGRTDVLRIYHLDRGYEALEEKLQAAGAEVRREAYDEFAAPKQTDAPEQTDASAPDAA